MKIEDVDFFYLAMPEILNIGDGSQDALLVRVRADGQPMTTNSRCCGSFTARRVVPSTLAAIRFDPIGLAASISSGVSGPPLIILIPALGSMRLMAFSGR